LALETVKATKPAIRLVSNDFMAISLLPNSIW
jgi:hypothetical protein